MISIVDLAQGFASEQKKHNTRAESAEELAEGIVNRYYNHLKRMSEQALTKRDRIKTTELREDSRLPRVLEYIRNNPGCTTRQMADYFQVSQGSISSSVQQLMEKGYIYREPPILPDKRFRRFFVEMKRNEFLEFHRAFLEEMHEITKKKNQDYGGGTDDAFYNFTNVEILGIKPEHGFLTRMFDKFSRIASFVKQGELRNESVKDSLLDLANYSILLAGYLKSREKID